MTPFSEQSSASRTAGGAGTAVRPSIRPEHVLDRAAFRQARPVGRTRNAITLLIPAFNEETGLAHTIEQARRVFEDADIDAEIIVVDDGSTDGTAGVATRQGARVVKHLYGRGYGHALRSGILEASHEAIVICDADGTYPLERIPDLLTMFDKGYDLVIGARTGKHFWGSFVKEVARRFFHWLCESATGTKIADANSGLRVFRRSVILPHLPKMCTGFSFTTSQTLCFHLLSRTVGYVPVEYHARIGKTKVRHIKDSLRTAQYIFQMFAIFNPVKLFTVLAFVPFLAGTGVLAGQTAAALAAGAGSWWKAGVLAGFAYLISAVLFSAGFVTYGVSRQRWPDAVGGQGAVEQ